MRRLLLAVALLATPAIARADGLPGTAAYPETYYLGGCTQGGALCFNGTIDHTNSGWLQSGTCAGTLACVGWTVYLFDASGNLLYHRLGPSLGGDPTGAVTAILTTGALAPGAAAPEPIIMPITITTTPEPASIVLMGSGLVGLLGAARRRRAITG